MKYGKLLSAVVLGAVVTAGLSACGSSDTNTSNEKATEDVSKFPAMTTNQAEAEEGGELKVAVVHDSQIKGVFSREFYSDAFDDFFMKPAFEEMFFVNEQFESTESGIAKKDIDVEGKKITISLTKDAMWSDGMPVIADDLIQSYLVIGHPDYTGIRYDGGFQNIVGMEEYNAGEAEDISGIKKIDDKTIEISYKEMSPSMKFTSETVWASAMPAHIFKDIEVADMESSDAVRKNPVTFGPYKISKITQGEAVEFTPNEYYYGEKPKLDKITMQIAPSNSIVEALKAKKYDMVLSMPTDTYDSYKDLEGYEILGKQDLAYTYLGFKLGSWDEKEGMAVYNPEAKMADKSLRQAMGYALDNNAIGEQFYSGLRQSANTIVPPIFGDYSDSSRVGYSMQDVEKANKILDDAGYAIKEGDEFRSNPDGSELVINFASMAGGETAQPIAEYYIDSWKEIGLNVQLATGRLIEFNSFYDMLQSDSKDIDVYQAAWGLSSDPSQSGLYGPEAAFNYTRFATPEHTELLEKIDSVESFDNDFMKDSTYAWQAYVEDEAFVIPTLFRDTVLPVSENVTNFDFSYAFDVNPWATVGLTK